MQFLQLSYIEKYFFVHFLNLLHQAFFSQKKSTIFFFLNCFSSNKHVLAQSRGFQYFLNIFGKLRTAVKITFYTLSQKFINIFYSIYIYKIRDEDTIITFSLLTLGPSVFSVVFSKSTKQNWLILKTPIGFFCFFSLVHSLKKRDFWNKTSEKKAKNGKDTGNIRKLKEILPYRKDSGPTKCGVKSD